jgi:hypothetical protein
MSENKLEKMQTIFNIVYSLIHLQGHLRDIGTEEPFVDDHDLKLTCRLLDGTAPASRRYSATPSPIKSRATRPVAVILRLGAGLPFHV